jgi:MerC mercury resistance protein
MLAAVGASLGLGTLQSLRGYVDYAIQAMAVLALIGNFIAYRQHRQRGPLLLGVAAAGVVFLAYYGYYHVALVYVGLLGLATAAGWNVIAQHRCATCCAGENP